MGLIVQKFGGTSVADAQKIHRAAKRAIAAKETGHEVVVVVSAMGHTTDELIDLARHVCENPPKREMDQLLATGEQVTIALMAMAIHAQGHQAISFTGGQIGLVTDNAFSKARIQSINKQRIFEQLDHGKIVIIAGFQGVTPEGDYTTLGRGGSNATLVAVGAVLNADFCENYTDVDGIYTADPRIVKNARKIDRISYDEMLELSGLGASVSRPARWSLPRSTTCPSTCATARTRTRAPGSSRRPRTWNTSSSAGAAIKKDLVRVTMKTVPDHPGVASRIFSTIAQANIVVDDIIQNVMDDGTANISFTVEHGDLHDIQPVVDRLVKELGAKTQPIYQAELAKISVVGVGMRTHTGVAQRMFGALAEAKVNIQNITTSEIKISCIISKDDANRALQVVHDAFELEKKKA
jgi:aspartate kinase